MFYFKRDFPKSSPQELRKALSFYASHGRLIKVISYHDKYIKYIIQNSRNPSKGEGKQSYSLPINKSEYNGPIYIPKQKSESTKKIKRYSLDEPTENENDEKDGYLLDDSDDSISLNPSDSIGYDNSSDFPESVYSNTNELIEINKLKRKLKKEQKLNQFFIKLLEFHHNIESVMLEQLKKK